PHEPLTVYRETVREATGVGVKLYEEAPSTDLAPVGIEIEREDRVTETLGVRHDTTSSAPTVTVGTLDLVVHAGDPPIRIESVQGARRREPIVAPHRACPETTLTIALAIVESVPAAIRFGIVQDLEEVR